MTNKLRKKYLSAQEQTQIETTPTVNNDATLNENDLEIKSKSYTWLIVLMLLTLVILIITPKPQLITYQKLGLVSQSIYWPGIFGSAPRVFDSTLKPRADLERNTLYLCHDLKQPSTCQKYRITQKNGVFSVLKKLILG